MLYLSISDLVLYLVICKLMYLFFNFWVIYSKPLALLVISVAMIINIATDYENS